MASKGSAQRARAHSRWQPTASRGTELRLRVNPRHQEKLSLMRHFLNVTQRTVLNG